MKDIPLNYKMAPANWIYLFFILTFSLPVKGYEACFGNRSTRWQYLSRSHSCFKFVRELRTWTEARDYCRQVQLGNNFGVTTHLFKIDDIHTDYFVSNIITRYYDTWIGLHYMEDKDGFRWDGYPDETPKYINRHWEELYQPYVYKRRRRSWVGEPGDAQHYFVCQQQAKTIGTVTCEQDVVTDGFRIRCTSEESPVEAKCEWTYKYDVDTHFLPWRLINDSINDEIQIHNTTTTGGIISYITTCTTVLTSDNTNLTIGTLLFKMKMYPDINVWYISTNQKAQTVESLNIKLELPETPTLRVFPENLEASSCENQMITFLCKVNSGNPPVHSLTLSCEFPFGTSNEKRLTSLGSSYVIDTFMSRDLIGKSCKCIANHMFGRIESSPLTLRVMGTLPKGDNSSTSLSAGAIVGLILASNVVVILLTIAAMFAFKKLREKRHKPQTSHDSRSGCANPGFAKEEPENPDSSYVYVPENARLPGKETLSRKISEQGIYEGEEDLPDAEDSEYQTVTDGENERDRRGYDTLHREDPIYMNLTQEPSQQYVTIAQDDKKRSA